MTFNYCYILFVYLSYITLCNGLSPELRLDTSNWMSHLKDIIGELPLTEITIPGSHDTLSYELDRIISNGALGSGFDELISWLLHQGSRFSTSDLSLFFQRESRTQHVDIINQLNAGIRVLDIRQMWSSDIDNNNNWYGLHFMQTVQPVFYYLKQVRLWLDEHPEEIIVIILSRHGNLDLIGLEQYPGTPIYIKHNCYKQILSIFNNILFDTRISTINETTITQLVERNHRVVIYASDYDEFTDYSPFALDASTSIHKYPVRNEEEEGCNYKDQEIIFQYGKIRKNNYATNGKQTLMTLKASSTPEQVIADAILLFDIKKKNNEQIKQNCAHSFLIPGMQNCSNNHNNDTSYNNNNSNCWCPLDLFQVVLLNNYYTQITLEKVIVNQNTNIHTNWSYPNILLADGINNNGDILTGYTKYDKKRSYSYVSSILYSNIKQICASQPSSLKEELCIKHIHILNNMRLTAPLQLWNDPKHGRNDNWPDSNTTCTTTLSSLSS